MRPTTAVSLLAIYLLVSGVRAEDGTASPLSETRGSAWLGVGTGHGVTRETAEQKALADARDKVAAYLRQREPSLRWVPSVEDLRRWNMIERTIQREKTTPSRVGPVFSVDVHVAVSNRTFQEILRRDRQLLAAKLLAALVALLAVAAGYFRLEELTRGYYTGTLRVLSLVGIVLIGAGLWLIF